MLIYMLIYIYMYTHIYIYIHTDTYMHTRLIIHPNKPVAPPWCQVVRHKSLYVYARKNIVM